ncbi:MAG: hypothetical protein RL660_710 [Bacteroidota bacterium]|jgi:dihydroneopterin aldolase
MWTISIKDAKFAGTHGVYPQEALLGNNFIVNAAVSFHKVGITKLEDSIDYAHLYGIISEEMGKHYPLLETLIESIAAKVEAQFGGISAFEISISKLNPAFGTRVGSAEVRLSKHYNQ